MKNLTNIFLSFVLTFAAIQALGQDAESNKEFQNELTENLSADTSYGYDNPLKESGNSASGCWSDYLRQLYLEDAASYGADLLAASKSE